MIKCVEERSVEINIVYLQDVLLVKDDYKNCPNTVNYGFGYLLFPKDVFLRRRGQVIAGSEAGLFHLSGGLWRREIRSLSPRLD